MPLSKKTIVLYLEKLYKLLALNDIYNFLVLSFFFIWDHSDA